jgi:hypothetical protein
MNRKLAIFTVFFSIMCFENSIRILDLMMGWQFPIPDERPTNLDFSSNYDVSFSPLFRSKFLIQKEKGPYALAQTLTVMMCMILNNTLWIRRKSFSPTWHTIHYFLASIFLVMYIPRHNLWPVMQSSKYGYTNMNIFIYQMVLGTMAGLTQFHHFIVLLATMVYQVVNVKLWYDVKLSPICLWDGYLHVILPTFLMLAHGYVGSKERIKKDLKMQADCSDVKKVLGSLE